MVIDTFLFSEAMESEVLLAKLHSESGFVDHWVGVENQWTTKGERKDLHLKRLLSLDARFGTFVDRLHVVELNERFSSHFQRSRGSRTEYVLRKAVGRAPDAYLRQYTEQPYFYAEYAQRDAALPTILSLMEGKSGWVIVTDVDEVVDISTPDRQQAWTEAIASGASIVLLPRKRFLYDFDNLQLGRFRSVPLVRSEVLRNGSMRLGTSRVRGKGLIVSPHEIVLEYSYCYGVTGIERKLASFAHVGYGPEATAVALECNHALARPGATPSPDAWCVQLPVDSTDHPKYVAENFESLRTGAVNVDFAASRRGRYPSLFGPS